jgi:4-hydroxy-3-polyprenylbenzoate decarboxylase
MTMVTSRLRSKPTDWSATRAARSPVAPNELTPTRWEFLPDHGKEEGPFSEWTGYYASGEKFEPLIKVHRLYHRDNPIITASPEYRPTARAEHCYELLRAAYIRDQSRRPACRTCKRWRVIFAVF